MSEPPKRELDKGAQAEASKKSKMTLPKFTLTYFGIAGRARPLRFIFATAKIPFTNKVVEFKDFPVKRTEWPLGQLPILEIEYEGEQKRVVTQTSPIARYIGKLSGLYPEDPFEALRVDEIIGAHEDHMFELNLTLNHGAQELFLAGKPDMEAKVAARKKLIDKYFPRYFKFFEKKLEENATGWFVGDKPTVADFIVSSGTTWLKAGVLDGIPKSAMDSYPLLSVHNEKVLAIPEVVAFINKHPEPYGDFDYIPGQK